MHVQKRLLQNLWAAWMSARSGPDGHLPRGFKLPLQPLLHEHIWLHLPEPAARFLRERRPVLLLRLSKRSIGLVNKPHNLYYQEHPLNKDFCICQCNQLFQCCCQCGLIIPSLSFAHQQPAPWDRGVRFLIREAGHALLITLELCANLSKPFQGLKKQEVRISNGMVGNQF